MADPGYGPNGLRIDGSGLISYEANPPPKMISAGFDRWTIFPMGTVYVPAVAPLDDEAHKFKYLGGV